MSSGQYEAAFDAARDVLLEAHFEIDRIDAASGVITTRPRTTAGLLTPWEPDQTTASQELADASSTHRRRVRVSFQPAAADRPQEAGTQTAPGGDAIDLRKAEVALNARVEVFIDRVRRPGRRLETESIRTSTRTTDPDLARRGLTPEYETTIDRDEHLAGRLAERIRERLATDTGR